MKKELKNLLLRQVDESVSPWVGFRTRTPPTGGWVRAIRQALGMSTSQLGGRMGLSRQGIADLEQREIRGSVTLASLQKAAEALDADLVYAIVPRTSLAETVREQARLTAGRELGKVAHTMRLEAQGVSRDEYTRQLAERQEQLLRDRPRYLWDEEDSSTRK